MNPEKTTQTRKIKIKPLVFQGLLILSFIFLIVSVTFSWFTNGDHASVTGIQINVTEPDKMKVTFPGYEMEDGSFELQFNPNNPLKPLSGDGVYFYAPQIVKDENDNLVVDMKELVQVAGPGVSDAEPNAGGFYSVDFMVSASKPATLCLYGKQGDVTAGIFPAPLEAYKESFGQPDPGYICGAMRIAILQKNDKGEYVTKLIWAPDITTQLNVNEQNVSVGQGNHQNFMFIRGESGMPEMIQAANGSSVQGDVTYVFGEIADKIPVGDPMTIVPATTNENGTEAATGEISSEMAATGSKDMPYQGEYRLVIWVDGEDNECHAALMGGLVKVILHFGL